MKTKKKRIDGSKNMSYWSLVRLSRILQKGGFVYCTSSEILKFRGQFYNSSRLLYFNGACLSFLKDGSKRPEPLKKEGTAQGGSKKKIAEPKITLIGTDDSISVVSLEEGQKIAKRRNFRLVKMVEYDTKTQRPVYRLMTITEYNAESKKEKASKSHAAKREKLVTFTSRIDKHDILAKVKMMEKWIAKDYDIRVVINGDSNEMSAAENVYKSLEDQMKETCRFLQKRQVSSDIKFNIKGLPRSKTSAKQEEKDRTLPSADS